MENRLAVKDLNQNHWRILRLSTMLEVHNLSVNLVHGPNRKLDLQSQNRFRGQNRNQNQNIIEIIKKCLPGHFCIPKKRNLKAYQNQNQNLSQSRNLP